MDISGSLKAAENAIRDTITYILTKKYGPTWPANSGISEDRLSGWKEKQSIEERRLGRADPRIIYYADFYDLKTLISKNWENGLSTVFGKQKEFLALLDILEEFRNPEAHRRELLLHEKQLAIGISGRIRTNISEYFSRMETRESYYPRLECVQDNYGNSWAIGERNPLLTGRTLRLGDVIEFSVSGTDPLGEDIEFSVAPCAVPYKFQWKESGDFSVTLDSSHVQNGLWIHIAVRSKREFHATSDPILGKIDDIVKFGYEVLPPRTSVGR
jgi:hypothetical protein